MKFSINHERNAALRTQFYALLHQKTNHYYHDNHDTGDVFSARRFERLWHAREFKDKHGLTEYDLVECRFIARVKK